MNAYIFNIQQRHANAMHLTFISSVVNESEMSEEHKCTNKWMRWEDEFSWDLNITFTCQIIWAAIITGHTQNNDAHKTCFTALMTHFLKCPDSVTAGSASNNRESVWICVTGSYSWWSIYIITTSILYLRSQGSQYSTSGEELEHPES